MKADVAEMIKELKVLIVEAEDTRPGVVDHLRSAELELGAALKVLEAEEAARASRKHSNP